LNEEEEALLASQTRHHTGRRMPPSSQGPFLEDKTLSCRAETSSLCRPPLSSVLPRERDARASEAVAEEALGSRETPSQQAPKETSEDSQDLHLVKSSPEDVSSEPHFDRRARLGKLQRRLTEVRRDYSGCQRELYKKTTEQDKAREQLQFCGSWKYERKYRELEDDWKNLTKEKDALIKERNALMATLKKERRSDFFVTPPDKLPHDLLHKIACFEQDIAGCEEQIWWNTKLMSRLAPDDPKRDSLEGCICHWGDNIRELEEHLHSAQQQRAMRARRKATTKRSK